jgi:putative nucleotidyltransferase with HDIG domain
MKDAGAEREAAVNIVRRLQGAGFIAFWAGGCVRDMLLGAAPKDYDIATNAVPDQVLALFPRAVAVGKAFGVVCVQADGSVFEVATFRQDHEYRDGRRPEGVTFSDPQTDAQRRDFTINAMFFDPVAGQLHDFVSGQADLAARTVRCVGNPADRFREDRLRMLRAVRFSAALDFALENSAAEAIRTQAGAARDISSERVRDEISRILLEARRPGDALRMLDGLGLLGVLLPEVAAMKGQAQPPEFHPEGDVFEHTVQMLNLMGTRSLHLAFAALLHDVGKPGTARQAADRIRFDGHAELGAETARAILRRLRFSNDDTDAIVTCVAGHMRFQDVPRMRASTLRRMVGATTFPVELELHRLDCLASHGGLDHYEQARQFAVDLASQPALPKPWITGHDILPLGVRPGPEVGLWHRAAYEAQLEQRFENREALLVWLANEVRRAATCATQATRDA